MLCFNISISNYNIYEINSVYPFFLMDFIDYKGEIKINASVFTEIRSISSLISMRNSMILSKLLIENTHFMNIYSIELMKLTNIIEFFMFSSHFSNMIINESKLISLTLIIKITFINITLTNLHIYGFFTPFEIISSQFFLNNSMISVSFFENTVFSFENSSCLMSNSQFSSLNFSGFFILTQNSLLLSISFAIFSSISGKTLIYLDEISTLSIDNSIFKSISLTNLYDINSLILMNISNSSIFFSSFTYLFNVNPQIQIILYSGGEIAYNSITKGLIWSSQIFFEVFFSNNFIHDNNFSYQALFRILGATYFSIEAMVLTHNFFLFPDRYCCVTDLENLKLSVHNSYFQGNGLIENPVKRPRTLDSDCTFDFYDNEFIEFVNNSFIGDEFADMTGGFLCCATCGNTLILENNSFIIVRTNVKFGYKGLLMDFRKVLIKKVNFTNIPCSLNNFYLKNGAILFYASTSYFYRLNQNLIILDTVSFSNCSSEYGGSLVIISYQRILMNNCDFFHSSARNYGGNFAIIAAENFTLTNINITGSRAYEGSAFYIKTVKYLKLDGLLLEDSRSEGSGVIYLRDIDLFEAKNIISLDTSSASNGGLFFIFNVFIIVNDIKIQRSSSDSYGGVFYLDANSIIEANGVFANDIYALFGGGFISVNRALRVILHNCRVSKINIFKGGVLDIKAGVFAFIFLVNELVFYDIVIEDSMSINGIGMILIKTYNEGALMKIENVYSKNCSALAGSFLYFLSNSKLFVKNVTIYLNRNNCIFIAYSFKIQVYLEDIVIKACRIEGIGRYMIEFNEILVEIANLSLLDNYAEEALIKIDECDVFAKNFLFVNNSKYSIFYLKLSTFKSRNISSVNNSLFFCYSFDSNFSVVQCLISNSFVNNGNEILKFELGTFEFNDSQIKNNNGLIFSFLQTNSVVLFNLSFEDNSANVFDFTKPNDLFFQNKEVYITRLFINNCKFSSKLGGISNWVEGLINVTIENSEFIGHYNEKNIGEIGVLTQEINILVIKNSKFTNFANALQSFSQNKGNFTIEDSQFLGNIGYYGPAMSLIGFFNLSLSANTFANNSAIINQKTVDIYQSGIAGVLFFQCNPLLKCRISINSCIFLNNSAEFMAPTVYSSTPILQNSHNFFLLNRDSFNFTDAFFSYPLKISLAVFSSQDSQSISSMIITSGVPFNLSFTIEDIYNQVLKFDDETIITLKDLSQFAKIHGGLASSKAGTVFFEEIVIFSESNQTISLQAKGLFLAKDSAILSKIEITKEIILQIRPCSQGEIILNDNTCHKCKAGFYSFANPMLIERKYHKCSMCMPNAICLGGVEVYPIENYYKLSKTSTYMIQCFNERACLGYINSSISEELLLHGACEQGNYGVLCFYCEMFYGKDVASGKCNQCGSLVIIKLILIIFFVVVYILLNNAISERSCSQNIERVEGEENFNNCLKLIVNHGQQVGVLFLNEIITFSIDFKNFVKISDYLSMANLNTISNECIFQYFYYNPKNIYIYQLISTMLIPIIFSLITCLIWIFLNLFKKNKMNYMTKKLVFSKMKLFLVFCTFFFYSMILKSSMGLFQCIRLDINNSSVFLKQSPEIECWSS